MLKFKLLTVLLVSFLSTFAQKNVDKLIADAEKSTESLQKAKLYLQIAESLENDSSKCFPYIEKGILLARKLENDRLLAHFYYTKAHALDAADKYLAAVEYYEESLKYADKINDTLIQVKAHINIGVTQYYYGQSDKALKNYEASLKHSLQLGDNKYIAMNYNNIALIQKSKGKYVEAIKNFHKSLDINFKQGNQKSVANTYSNIGSIYWEQENYKDAKNCYQKSAEIYQATGDKKDLADIYINLGLIENAEHKPSAAVKYYEKAMSICKETDNQYGLLTAYMNIANIYDKQGKNLKAENYYLKSLKIAEDIAFQKGIISNLLNLSMIYAQQKKHQKAEKYAKKALILAQKTQDLKNIYNARKTLAINYSQSGKFNLAYDNILIYTKIKDSLFNLEKNKQLNEIRTKYETEKKEAEILLFKEKDKNQQLKIEKDRQIIKRTRIILIITVLSLILFLILFIQKRKSYLALVERNVQLTKLDIEKEKTLNNAENPQELIKIPQKTQKTAADKYQKSVLSTEQKHELIQDIIILMEEEKYFLNPHFTIDEFAKKLKTNRGYISQIINETFGMNFNHFVNEYRVKEARKFLINPEYDNYSLSGIASLAGFNTRATFNAAFKKFTGVTPSFFKQNSRK